MTVQSSMLIRAGGLRAVTAFVSNIMLCLVLISSLPVMWLWPFGGEYHPTVEVRDDAHLFQPAPLVAEIKSMEFRRKVHVVVLTIPKVNEASLNEEVLAYARHHGTGVSKWISQSNPNHWADGILILAVAPDSRKVGCYFGDDVKVSLSQQEMIIAAGGDRFSEADWYGGMISMAETSSDLIGRPPGGLLTKIVIPGALSVCGAVWFVYYMRRGLVARRFAKEALRSYSNTTHDYDATELRASTIPDDEEHGAQILTRYRWFCDEYEDVTRAWNDFGSPAGAQWFQAGMAKQTLSLRTRSRDLDSLEKAVSNGSCFLTMSPGWEDVWDNEIGPLMEDLQSLERMCTKIDSSRRMTVDTSQTRDWIRWWRLRVAQVTSEMESGSCSPSAALDELTSMSNASKAEARSLAREALKAKASRRASSRIQHFNKRRRSRLGKAYGGSWAVDNAFRRYDAASTICVNADSPGACAISSDDETPFDAVVSVAHLLSDYVASSRYVQILSGGAGGASDFSGGSDSSVTGYGSGSGFSGAGSSSSF